MQSKMRELSCVSIPSISCAPEKWKSVRALRRELTKQARNSFFILS